MVARRVLSLYRGMESVPRLFCQRTLSRNLQSIHRWRDRRRRAAKPHTPTKYDLADLWQRALAEPGEAVFSNFQEYALGDKQCQP
jgi:hypothetical protein